MKTQVLNGLYDGLTARRTPQDVASDLVHLGVAQDLNKVMAEELHWLSQAAGTFGMNQTFRRHPGLERAYQATRPALRLVCASAHVDLLDADADDAASLTRYVTWASALLGLSGDSTTNLRVRRPGAAFANGQGSSYAWSVRHGTRGRRGDSRGHAHPNTGYTATERREALPGISVRTYRSAVASVNHLEQRTQVLAEERDREAAITFAKTRLASTVDRADFTADIPTAAFVAYYTARLGLRTVFTSGAQERPMDTIAEALLGRALDSPTCRADVIARVLTRPGVLARLNAAEQGELLGSYYNQLIVISRVLERSFDPKRSRTRMVARPGDDSSTWNAASRAFNQARTGWLNLSQALLGADSERLWFGKVPALVAGDVAFWHASEGSAGVADVECFAELPLPWEVVLGTTPCTVEQLRAACARHGLDPDKTGWTKPYSQSTLEVTSIAPELVHGVLVSSPALGAALRRAGVFAGRVTVIALPTDSAFVGEGIDESEAARETGTGRDESVKDDDVWNNEGD